MLFIKINALIVMCFFTSITGGNIVDELRQRYNYVTNECVDAQNTTHPAYECSGLLVRGVYKWPQMKFGWSLKPDDKEQNAFSFTYLRRDHIIGNKGVYEAGFILYPHLKTPPHKLLPKMLCSFPNSAITNAREDRGCGRNEHDENGLSEPCHTQNITTASQWMEHYNSPNVMACLFCGFKMTKERETEDFAVTLQAYALLKNQNEAICTELRVEGWDEDNVKSIPIQAFFYYIGTKKGYEIAAKFRDEFYAQSGGETVPIVGIKLPTDEDPNVHITGDEASA